MLDPKFSIGTKVSLDTIQMDVTAILFRGGCNLVSYECKYVLNGEQKEVWVEKWRLADV